MIEDPSPPGPGWQEAIDHMAELIRKEIDEEVLKKIIEEARRKEKDEHTSA